MILAGEIYLSISDQHDFNPFLMATRIGPGGQSR